MKKFILLMAVWCSTACGAVVREDVGVTSAAATGSSPLVAGVTGFISADLASSTTIVATQPGYHIVVADSSRVNALAANGGGFVAKSVILDGRTSTNDDGSVDWTTYDAQTGGPVSFPQFPSPTGITPFISADLTSGNSIVADHSYPTGCIGELSAINRVNQPAASGGGFQIKSVKYCDTSAIRWAVY